MLIFLQHGACIYCNNVIRGAAFKCNDTNSNSSGKESVKEKSACSQQCQEAWQKESSAKFVDEDSKPLADTTTSSTSESSAVSDAQVSTTSSQPVYNQMSLAELHTSKRGRGLSAAALAMIEAAAEFNWPDYLAEENAVAAPTKCFKQVS